MTAPTQRRILPEQKAQHGYNPVPPRASAAVATEDAPASRRSGERHAGMQADAMPHVTADKAWQYAEVDEDSDAIYPKAPPSSVRRYRPPATQQGSHAAYRRNGYARGFYAFIIGSSILAGIAIASLVPPLWQRGSDQLQYGYPRTWQTDANVGHGSARYPDTHFIALNNHGYIEVIEIPQGVPGKDAPPQLYLIAQPDNASADQAPVTLAFEDINGDGKPDMVVRCNNNRFILYNDGHSFKEHL